MLKNKQWFFANQNTKTDTTLFTIQRELQFIPNSLFKKQNAY
jgi:hypothetical protein